jgi:hypothetical protein
MASTVTWLRRHRYSSQITGIALLIALLTFVIVKLEIPRGPWNIAWMVILPFALGVALNQNVMRWIMGPVLVVVSLIATTVIGNAMGGM